MTTDELKAWVNRRHPDDGLLMLAEDVRAAVLALTAEMDLFRERMGIWQQKYEAAEAKLAEWKETAEIAERGRVNCMALQCAAEGKLAELERALLSGAWVSNSADGQPCWCHKAMEKHHEIWCRALRAALAAGRKP